MRDKHTSIPHLALLQRLEALRNALLRHRELLNNGPDLMLCRKRQHLLVNLPRRNQASLDLESGEQNGHVWDFHVVLQVHAEGVHCAACRHDGEVQAPVGLARAADEEMVDLGVGVVEVHHFGERLHFADGVELVGAELHGFVLLGVGAGEDDNVTTHLRGELDGEMA